MATLVPSRKVYVDASPIQGRGVFAAVEISRGEAILAIDDSRIVTPHHPLHPEAGEFDVHCDYLADGLVVLMQIPERFINHSCDPNTFVRTVTETRYVFALHEIHIGEEITYDYSVNGFGNVTWECHCGSPNCRRTIHADFFHLPLELQIRYLPLLDDWYLRAYRLQIEDLLEKILQT